ncbi:spore germination protein [Cohnella ginsengisoli]|uniref:Spore germination protein n=1 Tax=Cohnella ginsengisoli TaxID=425004 RepID=A0A9X4KLA1_9BACL|nr:GerAB/ArcD/ProY family transporter [Cohnella ginsengisoli]MDG0793861.1 spore germination protein [Cohnella ginsengisoli]
MIACLALYEIGSTTLFLLAADAKQDAWIAMTMAAVVGFFLLAVYLAMHRQDPDRDLFALCRAYLGKWTGMAIGLSFVGYFAYEASRNLRDLVELTSQILLNDTPLFVIALITISVVANTARYGARMLFLCSLVLFPFVVVGYLLLVLMLSGQHLIHAASLLPVLENGWHPVFKAAFPQLVSFPFGQTILFLVFFPLVRSQTPGFTRSVYMAYVGVSIFLIGMNELILFVLGQSIAEKVTFPLLESVQLIEFSQVFERMDILFVFVLFLGLGVKLAAFFYRRRDRPQPIDGHRIPERRLYDRRGDFRPLLFCRPIIRTTSGWGRSLRPGSRFFKSPFRSSCSWS